MIQGRNNEMDKAVFALILHTLQEADSERTKDEQGRDSELENSYTDSKNSYTFIEI